MTASPQSAGPAAARNGPRLSRQPMLAATVALVAGLLATLATLWVVQQELSHAGETRFEQRTTRVTAVLQQKLAASAAVLNGARGLMGAVPAPTSAAWREYVNRLDLEGGRSPVRVLGYADVRGRTFPGAASEASAPFTATLVAPAAEDAPAFALPNTPDSRVALSRAVESAQVALAAPGPGQGPQDNADERPPLWLYLAVYGTPATPATATDRQANLAGILFARLDPDRLFDPARFGERGLDLQVYTGQASAPVFATASGDEENTSSTNALHRSTVLSFGGTTFTLAWSAAGSAAAAANASVETTVAVAGVVASLVLAALVLVLARLYADSRKVAGESRTQSTLNEARMMGIIRSSMEAIITIDESQRIVIFNPAAERVFGCSAMDAIGASLSRFLPERFREGHARHVEQFGVTGVSDRQMGRQRVLYGLRANGEEFPIEASISQIRDATGKLYTVMLRDVTERVRAENDLKQSREELRELSANLQNVREEEKTRIARELHDDLGQQLTALKMDLSALEHMVGPDSGASTDTLEQLRSMRRLIDATVASVRRIAADLRPVMLDDLGLLPAIDWLAGDFTHRYGIEVDRRIAPGDTNFSRTSATTLFRIVQEALTNVAKHAEATRVELMLRVEGNFCVLRVSDNGRGSHPAGADGANAPGSTHFANGTNGRAGKSFGIIGIRERAHMLGGSVAIDTADGKGFALTVTFPREAVQQEETLS